MNNFHNLNISYREVIPNNSNCENFRDIEIVTGTQHTLQDIKTDTKAGGYSFKDVKNKYSRNRFLYWRTHHDVLEVTDISLDYNLLKNKLRFRFSDSTILSLSIAEHENCVILLVTTVSTLHRFIFPHKISNPDTKVKLNHANQNKALPSTMTSADILQKHSIFYDAYVTGVMKDHIIYHVIDANGTVPLQMPHTAACYLSTDGSKSYYALANQTRLMLHILNNETAIFVNYELKDQQLMPRFLTNLKGALIGKNDYNNYAVSMEFCYFNNEIYVWALYCNKELRLWSTITLQNVCTINVMDHFLLDDIAPSKTDCNYGPQSIVMRKVDDNKVCVFITYNGQYQFIAFEADVNETEANKLCIGQIWRYTAPALTLMDFDVNSNRIWALWNNVDGEFSVSTFTVDLSAGPHWKFAAIEPPPEHYFSAIEQGSDPREAYISYIFQPGKFSRSVIAKALESYISSRNNVRFDLQYLSLATLKEQVCQAIDEGIQNEIKDFTVTDEDYLEISTRQWEQYYSCCEQYYVKESQIIGIFILKTLDAVCLVREQRFAILRPCDDLEHYMMNSVDNDAAIVPNRNLYTNEHDTENFLNLIIILSFLEKYLPEDLILDLDLKLSQLDDPLNLVYSIAADLVSDEPVRDIMPADVKMAYYRKIQNVTDMSAAMEMLLQKIDLSNYGTYMSQDDSEAPFSLMNTLYASDYGLSILAETIKQKSKVFYLLCRNLLILQQTIRAANAMNRNTFQDFNKSLLSRTVPVLRAYYMLIWTTETPVSPCSSASLELSWKQLEISKVYTANPYFYNNIFEPTTLLELYLKCKGFNSAINEIVQNGINLEAPTMQNVLFLLVHYILRRIWVLQFDFTFGEWLFITCQHNIILDYNRILKWCPKNRNSRAFMLAISYLHCDEVYKAFDLFQQIIKGLLTEKFLFNCTLKDTKIYKDLNGIIIEKDDTDEQFSFDTATAIQKEAAAVYFLRLMRLFEENHCLDYMIELSQVAVHVLPKDHHLLSCFHATIFINSLKLEHYEEAYHALTHNSNPTSLTDCLRELIMTLFERKRLDLLMHFPYKGLQDQFEDMVESRARNLSMEHNEVYDFLYSYHVNMGNMRRASAIIYEQALRLQIEYEVPSALTKRCDALLMCLNVMYLIDERYRWIAKPNIRMEGDKSVIKTVDLVDFNIDVDNIRTDNEHEVVVLNLEDVRREWLLAEALKKINKRVSGAKSYRNAGSHELAYLLSTCGLYSSALKLAQGFNLPLIPIFECLTTSCVRATQESASDVWAWLQENDLADLPHCSKAPDLAWLFLQKLIKKCELPNSTRLRCAVVDKILSFEAFVPQWLYNSYKLDNCPELLHLYTKHNRLIEAADLGHEMLQAMLGVGSEYFSFKHSMNVVDPPLALPVNTFDLLLRGLNLNGQKNTIYKFAYTNLAAALQKYLNALETTTQDKIKVAYRQKKNELF